jgi:hypothetical protein
MHWPFRRNKPGETDLTDELSYDLTAEIEERMKDGVSREEAQSAARRDFGNVSRIKEDLHELHSWPPFDRLSQDLRYGVRTLARNPVFTAMAILSLSLGIGANTAIYSVMDAVMIRALPVQDPSKLAILTWHSSPNPPVVNGHSGSSYPEPNAVWHPPYRLNLLSFFRQGQNELKILVGNTAMNEMAGRALPDYRLLNLRYGERFTPQDVKDIHPLPSGIIGAAKLIRR